MNTFQVLNYNAKGDDNTEKSKVIKYKHERMEETESCALSMIGFRMEF